MAVLIKVILPVVLIAGVAALAQRRLNLDARSISRAAFYMFGPSLVFDSLSSSQIGGGELGLIAAAVLGVTGLLWAIGEVLARLLRLPRPTQSAFLISILHMNAGNFGLPVVLFAFGQEGLARASLYFTVSAALSASLGVYLAARANGAGGLHLRRMAGVQYIYAAALGLAFNLAHVTLPAPLQKAVHLLGQASVPVMLVILGVQLILTFQRKGYTLHLPALATAVAARLLLGPTLAVGVAWLLGLSGLSRSVVIVESAMPTAVITTILATEFDCDVSFVTLAVFSSTLASVLTLTVLLNWLL